MRFFTLLLAVLIFNLPIISKTINNNNPDSAASLRVYNTTRLTTAEPVIDGVLNDECWKTGEWAGNFTQWIPAEGAKPSQKTEMKILFDNENLYVAIRVYDSEPEKISRRAGRRDELLGDATGVCFDSYNDNRTGFEFDLTAAGQKIDAILTNPSNADCNWNAVWDGKSGLEDSAWVAEMKIPLSQLRYSNDEEQIWGLHCWRWIDRFQEESDWEVQSSKGPGMLYLFGELRGLKGLQKSRRFEVMPYALGKLNTFKKEPGNPYADDGKRWLGNAGLDAKIGLSSNLTLDLTVNPDFGQVEADPSVMNITAFETFFDEKRPFFLEGKNIFDFGFEGATVFYTRRIGHQASYYPPLFRDEYLKMPDKTTILDAVKLSGKSSDGLSIGIMQSLASNVQADISSPAGERQINLEPLTNYFVGRVLKDFDKGTTILGGMITATNRFINDSHLDFLSRNAYTGGIDLLHQWNDKEYYVNAVLIGSTVNGDKNAILQLQNSSARYYGRPDANHVGLDTNLTGLNGHGGKIRIGKGSKGLWRYYTELNWRSPGLELNDLGFMQTTDIIQQSNYLSFFITEPVSVFRSFNASITESNKWDYGFNYLSSTLSLNVSLSFLNNWSSGFSVSYTPEAIDTRILRGGYSMKVPNNRSVGFNIGTDAAKPVSFYCSANLSASGSSNSNSFDVHPGLSIRPANTFKIGITMDYSQNTDNLQYITSLEYINGTRYILGKIDQKSLGITFKVDWNISPEISLQYYASPFAAVGKFTDFKYVTDPLAGDYNKRFSLYNTTLNYDHYLLDENNDGKPEYMIGVQDFNFCQLRSNLVFRWEYSPGSQLYLVWASELTGAGERENNLTQTMGKLTDVYPNSIFLVKFSYWFTI